MLITDLEVKRKLSHVVNNVQQLFLCFEIKEQVQFNDYLQETHEITIAKRLSF